MEKRLFDHCAGSGVTKWWHYDESTDTARIETEQSGAVIGSILDQNKAERAAHDGKFGDGMHKIASIPMVLYHEWKKEGLFERENHPKLMMRLRDPSYANLLTVPKI